MGGITHKHLLALERDRAHDRPDQSTNTTKLQFGGPMLFWWATYRNLSEGLLTEAEMTQSFVTQAHPVTARQNRILMHTACPAVSSTDWKLFLWWLWSLLLVFFKFDLSESNSSSVLLTHILLQKESGLGNLVNFRYLLELF